MRKGFDGLSGLVVNELAKQPSSGDVFVFVNRSRNQMKLLHWERGGLVLYHKRLERGQFFVPDLSATSEGISWPDLVLIVEGISLSSVRRKARYEPTNQ